MLAGERVDLALANDSVGYALARQNAKAEVVAADKAMGEEVHYIAFSRKSSARRLIPQINDIISALRDESAIERTIRGSN